MSRRRFLSLEVARAGTRAIEVDRLHRIELDDILGIDEGDDEKFEFYKPALRDFVERSGSQLEPIMAVRYPWWTAHPPDEVLIANQIHRSYLWIAEARRRLQRPTLAMPRAGLVHHLEAENNVLGDLLNQELLSEYTNETLRAHNAGETFLPREGQ